MRSGRERRRDRAAALVVALLILAACSTDSRQVDVPRQGETTPIVSTTTPVSQPPGSRLAEVRPYIEDLVRRLDEVADRIVRNPQVVLDPNSADLVELKEIYTTDSDTLTAVLEAWRKWANEGIRVEPVNAGATLRTEITGDIEAVDDNTVKAPTCNIHESIREVDRGGVTVRSRPREMGQGQVHAKRVDARWRLERVEYFENTTCTT